MINKHAISTFKYASIMALALISGSANAAVINFVALYDGNDGTYGDGSDWLSDIINQDLTEGSRMDWIYDNDLGTPGNQLTNPQTTGGLTITGTTFKELPDNTEAIAGTWSYTSPTDDINYLALKFDGYFALYSITDYVLGQTIGDTWAVTDYIGMDVLAWDETVVGVFGDPAYMKGRTNFALSHGTTYSVVPVPAAVWLFGSGLIGLAGVARRKTA